jgi:hypothetical protein
MINTDLSRRQEWRAVKGFDNQFTLTFLQNGSAFDTSSYEFSVNIRKIGDSTNVVELTEGDGITNGGASGIVTILLDETDSDIIAKGYFYEIIYTNGSFTNRLLQGTFNLVDDYNTDNTNRSLTLNVDLNGTDVRLNVTLGGGGSGLESFTSGNLSPLFTTSLGNDELVNPALTFAQIDQNPNLVFAGPATAPAAAPTFRALVRADLPFTGTPNGTNFLRDDLSWQSVYEGHVIENAGTPLTARANLNIKNGLTAVDNTPDTDVKLGGALVDATTTISGDGTASGTQLKFGDVGSSAIGIMNSYTVSSNLLQNTTLAGHESFFRLNSSGAAISSTFINGVSLVLNGATIPTMTITGAGSFKGAVYAADYSANYDERSLVDMGYVRSLTGATGAWKLASGGTLTGANVITGTTTNTIKYVFNSLAVTQVDGAGLWLSNTTSAGAGSQQVSPSLVLEGQGWKTNATAGSQSVKFMAYVLPIQGTANPTGELRIGASVNSAAYSTIMTLNTSGSIVFGGTSTTYWVDFQGTAAQVMRFSAGAFRLKDAGGSPLFLVEDARLRFFLNNSSAAANEALRLYYSNTPQVGIGMNGSDPNASTRFQVRGISSGIIALFEDSAATPKLTLFDSGSCMLNASTKSTNTGNGVLILGNAGTNATASQTDGIVIHAKDSSSGSANSTLALYTEQAVEAIGTFTASNKLRVWINNVEYWIELDAV